MQWVRVRQVEIQCREQIPFRFQDFLDAITPIGHVEEVDDGRADDFFVLGSDKQGGETDELELDEGDDASGEEAVDEVSRDEEGFGQEAEFGVNLNEPVHEDAPHLPLELGLLRHVVGVGHGVFLQHGGRQRATKHQKGACSPQSQAYN